MQLLLQGQVADPEVVRENFNKIRDALATLGFNLFTAAGTDTYTATISPAISAYDNTCIFLIQFTNANTGAATINLNGIRAISLKKNVSTDLASGDILAGQIFLISYDGTNFQTIGLGGSGGGGGGGGTWGSIAGTLSDQTDLEEALDTLQSEINAVNPIGNKLFNFYNFI